MHLTKIMGDRIQDHRTFKKNLIGRFNRIQNGYICYNNPVFDLPAKFYEFIL